MKILTNLHAKIKSAYRSEQSWKQAHSKAFQCLIELYREHFYHYLGLEYEMKSWKFGNLEFVILYMHPQVWNTISDKTTKVASKGTFKESIVILCKSYFLTSKTDFLISIIRFLDFWYQELKFLISINQLKVLDIKNSFSNIRKSFFDIKISNLM